MKVEIPAFETVRVIVIGDVMLDRYWHGGTQRISPEAPVPVVNVHGIEERAGGAGNVALNVSALGSKVTLLSLVGDDKEAQILENKLSSQVWLPFTSGYMPTITNCVLSTEISN
jgi:D-beta-D-heptose 7-phosphate kinase/D-beta-D-heptose 1-phosphate adenosyltransferase